MHFADAEMRFADAAAIDSGFAVRISRPRKIEEIEEDRGRSRKIEEDRGRSRKIEEDRGRSRKRSRKIEERSRKIEEDRGRSRKIEEKIEEDRGKIEEDRGRSRKIEEDRGRSRKIRFPELAVFWAVFPTMMFCGFLGRRHIC